MTEVLADHTTFGLGGPARTWLEPTSEAELIDAVTAVDAAADPLLLLGGGSNVLIADDGFDGTVIHTGKLRGVVTEDVAACSGAFITAAAGEPWDGFVAAAVAAGHVGVEALSGIPGYVGTAPIQNVGAYGQEVADTIARVRTWDRVERRIHTHAANECDFGYRLSRFKREPKRWVVLAVSFQFALGDRSAPVRYTELARSLGVEVGQRAPLAQVREAVLALRRGKGMVYDPQDPDSHSAGSFFTNPILASPDEVPDGAPVFIQGDGTAKTSAAWLIEHAGFGKGFSHSQARISSKHCLALTNPGAATTAEVVGLARLIRDGVQRAFGLTLEPEPRLVGVSLD